MYDFDSFRQAITQKTRLYILCNPHNPVGRVFTRDELEQIAKICLDHNLVICSDDVHYGLVYPPYSYTPIAALDAEIANRTITLIAPSKMYNLPGLKLSMAIVQNPKIRAKIQSQLDNYPSSALGIVAATAAYRHGQNWLSQLLDYLDMSRKYIHNYLKMNIPQINMFLPEGTYLAWLSFKKLDLPQSPYEYLLKKAKVAFYDGRKFGEGGDGFLRLNFACPRSILQESLERIEKAVKYIN